MPEEIASHRLGEVASVQTGPFGSQLHASDYRESGTPIITVEHLGDNEVLHRNLPLVSERDRLRLAKYSLVEGDVVFSRVGAIDRRAYVSSREEGWLFSGRLLRVRLTDASDAKFISHLLGHHDSVQWIRNHAVGSTMPCLNTTILSGVPLRLPPLPEQRRIAEILDTVDEAIRKTEEIIAKLKQVKRGLLHDLLTRGIDDNGELRDPDRHPEHFKDSPLGRIPKAWQVKELDQISEFVTSGSRGWADYYAESGALFIRIGNLTREHINLRFSNIQHVRPPVSGEGTRTSLEPGDLLISITADLGIIGVVPDDLGEAYVNQHVALVRVDSTQANSRWIGHYMAALGAQEQIRRLDDPGAKAGLNLPTIRALRCALPNRHEQDKIAGRIDALDDRIRRENRIRSKHGLIKTGLMEDLLTGRIRVSKIPTGAPADG